MTFAKRAAQMARAAGLTAALTAGLMAGLWAGAAGAEPAWLQIEAQPSLTEAEARVRELAGTFPKVAGFALSGGWYGLALGPYDSPEAAAEELRRLRREGLIPTDSYVADGTQFRAQFWPVGAALAAPQAAAPPAPAALAPAALAPAALAEPTAPEPIAAAPALAAAPRPAPEPVETLADARRLEAALSREGRMEIQSALAWQGFYASKIDGAFGRGTRASIAAWQEANGHEPTGVLASVEQAALLDAVAAERASLGLAPVEETQAGVAIELPLGLVEFDHYDPPFVHYREKSGSGVTVLLISQPGDQNALFGLYDAMQTLEIVPMTGPRERSKQGFTLAGENERIHSFTEAKLSAGLIKGFTLIYPADQAPRMARVLDAMKASFRPLGETALDPTLGKPMAVSRGALMAGLDVRHPEFSRSGFFIDAQGAVLTAAEGLGACGRITIEDMPARLALLDEALGIAVLTPETPLAPAAVAAFETVTAGKGAAVTVAGFSYPEALSAPVLSFGTLSDLAGLAGETHQLRLALSSLPGDVGGPVLDGAGAVLGVVLARPAGGTRLLPPDMTVAVQATALAPRLAEAGFAPHAAEGTGTLAAEDVAALAQRFTVQLSCWK